MQVLPGQPISIGKAMSRARAILDSVMGGSSYTLTVSRNGRTALKPGWIDGFMDEIEETLVGSNEFEYDELTPDGGAIFPWFMDTYALSPEDWSYLKFQLSCRLPDVVIKRSAEY